MTPQCRAVLHHLKHRGPLTPLTAIRRLGVERLASRVYDLRAAGHEIDRELVRVRTRAGEARVARYSLA